MQIGPVPAGMNNRAADHSLPKDAYLILTNNTAAQAASGAMNILVTGILTGTP